MKFLRLFVFAVMLTGFSFVPQSSYAQFGISVGIDVPLVAIAPPPLPVYVVPPPPFEGTIWLPGHWRWGPFGYFWVPGTWMAPPFVGGLWTPGYWGWRGGSFAWNEGYWGRHVGFYGGINYGGGYGGRGFQGGAWRNGNFVVNRSYVNVTNNYNNSFNHTNNASFNGGPGGVSARPTASERAAAQEHHYPMPEAQRQQIQHAAANPALRASVNNGRPSIAATSRPGVFSGKGVVAAKAAGPRNALAEQHNDAVRANPALAKGAAMPQAYSHTAAANAHPAATSTGAHQAQSDRPSPYQVHRANAPAERPQHSPAQAHSEQPNAASGPRPSPYQVHRATAPAGQPHPAAQVAPHPAPEGRSEPHPEGEGEHRQ